MALVGVNAWAQTNLLEADGVSITWTPKDGSATSLTYSSGITFTPGNSAEFALNIEFTGVTIDASNAFVIVEASNGALGTEVKKLRNINIDNVVYEYFPTLNDNIYMVAPSGYKYRFRVFKDGGHPNAGGKTNDAGSGSTTNWYGTYNRNLVAGYSSMMLPYEVSYNDLNAAGLTTYTFGAISGSTVTFNKLTTGTIAAYCPTVQDF